MLRVATAIHDELCRHHETPCCVELPVDLWKQCVACSHRIRRARQQELLLAARRLQRDWRNLLDQVQGDLARLTNRANEPKRPVPTIEDIYRDLDSLYDEFGDVTWDRRRQTIAVTTEPIELEGVYLGEFSIELDWGDLIGHPGNYRVIAIDAHPARSNENVTHPHVQDEQVCEGEGRIPIRDALEQGRIADFFLIVANLLRTYNSGSPYVSLSDWFGVTCDDCGANASDDERWTCENCDAAVCDGCYCRCQQCESAFCSQCISRCESCHDDCCRGCLTRCAGYRELNCSNCLDEQERCENCHDNSEEIQTGGDAASDSSAAVFANRLGETALPA